MATNVFISFRNSDGALYKEKLEEVFEKSDLVRDYSEDKDRSNMSDEVIKQYLYDKLKATSVTIVILTPEAINYKKKTVSSGWQPETVVDDWLYDELRYSLEDRQNNRTNGVIAICTPEAQQKITSQSQHYCHKCDFKTSNITTILDFNNLVRKNMFNVKDGYKYHQCDGVYDSLHDHYISLIPFKEFIQNFKIYIDNALDKRGRLDQFKPLTKQM